MQETEVQVSDERKDNRGRRVGLTRDRVVETAVVVLDRDGIDAFSLRRLAAELGVDPMSIYNHVANKDDLLDGVVESVMSELRLVRDPSLAWDDQIRQGAREFRRVALAHPNVSIVMLTRRVLTEVPLRLLREAMGPGLDLGLAPREALDLVRTLIAFLTGAILRELGSGMTIATNDPERTADRVADIERSGDDVLSGVAGAIAAIDHEALFEHGLDLLLAGLAARVSAP